jgi:hypothetical protein
MNLRTICRMIALFALTVAALAGAVAHAQSPLPLPDEGRGPSFQLILPILELRIDDQFVWPQMNAATYVIKAKSIETGAKYKWTMAQNEVCGDEYCFYHIDSNWVTMGEFFDLVKNGDTVKVTIVGKHADGSKSKSMPVELEIVEAEAASLIFPLDDALLASPQSFTWADVELPSSDTLIVKDSATGKTVVKLPAAAVCPGDVCSANPFTGGGLLPGNSYVWFVKTTGATDESVKSEKRTFTVANVR